MIGDAIALYELIRKIYGESKIISALFDVNGKRIEGDERLNVSLQQLKNNVRVWWYEIQPFEDYQFIRIPVNASAVIESLGTPENSKILDADFFRYIPVPDGRIYGGEIGNVKVKFMVFAYKPSDLLSTGQGKL